MASDALSSHLNAFEAYAVGLHSLLGDIELVTRSLELLLVSANGNTVSNISPSLPFVSSLLSDPAAVTMWCLDGTVLCGRGPEAVARALLLETAVKVLASTISSSSCPLSSPAAMARLRLLQASPTILVEALEPVAARVAGALAASLDDDSEAASYLAGLHADADVFAYARATEALLSVHPNGKVWSDAWQVALEVLAGPNSADRRACLQRLLPPLVAKTPKEEAAERLSNSVRSLLDGPCRAEVSDALSISVSFHSLLADHWRLHSLDGDHDELGERLIAAGLRFGKKEVASCRRSARFVMEATIQAAFAKPDAVSFCKGAAGATVAEVSTVWRSYWELFDALEEYGSHLIKASWEPVVSRLMRFLASLKPASGKKLPLCVMSPMWAEVLFARALAHDNDTVQKFVLGQLVVLDQATAALSESFVLGEILPRLSQNIDILYPKADVHQVFERQVSAFFTTFVRHHADGPALAARRLLLALLEVRAIHFTPFRVVLCALLEVRAPDALQACEAANIVEQFCARLLMRMPVSVRPVLASLLVRVASQLSAPAAPDTFGEAAECTARALAAIPDALLSRLRTEFGALIRALFAEDAETNLLQLLRGLVASSTAVLDGLTAAEALGRSALPQNGLQLTLGTVRSLWALQLASGEKGSEDVLDKVWQELLPTLQDIHRRSYLPRRASCCALFCATYATELFPNGSKLLEQHAEARAEMLAYAAARACALLEPTATTAAVAEETPWLWLYTLVLERFWRPGLPHGEAASAAAVRLLNSSTDDVAIAELDALRKLAAVAIVAALATKADSPELCARHFLTLWRANLRKPGNVIDDRFGICGLEGLGAWQRLRNEEYGDLHRVEREGLGRALEWRDTISVFLTAKWRTLAKLACNSNICDVLRAYFRNQDGGANSAAASSLSELGLAMLAEFETLQPPHSAYWSVVARKIIFPVVFGEDVPVDRQASELSILCAGLSGAIADGTGDSSTFMPRGCLAELASALCDPWLCRTEQRLCAGNPDASRPLTAAVVNLLSLGEVAVGVSRGIAVPLLSSLLCQLQGYEQDELAVDAAADLLAKLLLHKEATIVDGSFCHGPELASGTIDATGPGSIASLQQVCAASKKICGKFQCTAGLPRVLTLTALDALADSGNGKVPALIAAILRNLLAVLRETQEKLLNPPGAKPAANRPPTPMPLSQVHRTQLRGWQAVLILGCRADRKTAEFLLTELFWHLGVPHVPDVRDYQELLGCMLCTKFDDLAVQPLLVPMLRSFDAPVQVSASLLVIASYLFRYWATLPESSDALKLPQISALITVSAPYLTHNSAYVRGAVAWGMFQILDSPCCSKLVAGMPATDGELLTLIHGFLTTNGECIKMRRRLKPVFGEFDPLSHAALDCLVEKSLVLPNTGNAAVCVEGQEEHTFHDADFLPTKIFLTHLKAEVANEMETLWDRSDPSSYPSLSEEWHARIAEAQAQADPVQAPSATTIEINGAAGGIAGMQRKFIPLEKPEIPPAIQPINGSSSELGFSPASRRVRAPLIVIASLIDKAPNLAGLCRTCEIFNCQALCLPNVKITKEQSFQSISVTAEKWLPLREVPPTALRDYLLSLRRQGYALVGVEQTHNSVALDEWKFERQTALLLGAEKEGIDGELLPLLDACVEIPQSGQLRSLNVHVSGSLAIWEYTRQHRATVAITSA